MLLATDTGSGAAVVADEASQMESAPQQQLDQVEKEPSKRKAFCLSPTCSCRHQPVSLIARLSVVSESTDEKHAGISSS